MTEKLKRRIYKIYINERPLVLAHKSMVPELREELPNLRLELFYRPRLQSLLNCIDILEKGGQDAIILYNSDDPKRIYEEVKSLYRLVRAAGGLVVNENKRVLMIFRRGFWDLPKGKMELLEARKDAAVREVEEETGLTNVTLKRKLLTTRHTFKSKTGKRVLKINYWYLMKGSGKQELIPQVEEDIKKVEWFDLEKAVLLEPMYKSVRDVLLAFKGLS